MSRVGDSPMLDLELNLSPSRPNPQVQSQKASISSSSSEILSAESSCVSSVPADMPVNYPSSIVTTPMLVAGCPRCLMYVMLSEIILSQEKNIHRLNELVRSLKQQLLQCKCTNEPRTGTSAPLTERIIELERQQILED
ncbi:hypothetical protein DKX38_006593 [Salix brachista]|uniref:GIR1-like zinc ribbon domain-containing protein n=1 Tax=Salix brachista TaxID=2182728 RepID=A0A5N5N5W2_9ROSI|nr:hypothetical protein DKX38_006593 [Salix brachista]